MTGDIPAELTGLSRLLSLYLADNELTGCIPTPLRAIQANDLPGLDIPFCDVLLSGLAVSPGTLEPAFDPHETSYTVTVTAARITVVPTNDHGASFRFLSENYAEIPDADPDLDGHQIGLDRGPNAVRVAVISQGEEAFHLYVIKAVKDSAGPPRFPAEEISRSVAENTPPGENVGEPVTATDTAGDTLTYGLGGMDMDEFAIEPDTGQLMTRGTLDYETRNIYIVTVTATDMAGAHASIDVTIMVANVDEEGTVTLDSDRPVVGTKLTATLTDPDGMVSGVEWQWAKTMDMSATDSWMDIAGATSMVYTPSADDDGYYLRATAMYADGHGPEKTAMGMSANMVSQDPVIARYDANNNGEIEKSEVIKAINDYLFGGGDPTTKADVIKLINLYLFG